MAEVAFSLGDRDELSGLARAAGWRDVSVIGDELVLAVPTIDAVIKAPPSHPSDVRRLGGGIR